MKREHFTLVSEHFDLTQHSCLNDPMFWRLTHEGKGDVTKLTLSEGVNPSIYEGSLKCYNIVAHGELCIFIHIPTKGLAEEILQYIKDTEVLFI